jgi:hypothetical protein
MHDTSDQTPEFALIEAIAAALREELGVAIEDQPGFHDPSEAGQVNRAFRGVVRTILRSIAMPDEDRPAFLSKIFTGWPSGGWRPACSTPARSST